MSTNSLLLGFRGRLQAPAELVRARSVVLLTGSAGCVDTAVFLKTHVFPANMTGNTVLMGLAIVRLNCGDATLSALAFAGFILGAAASAWTVSPPGATHQWSPRLSLALFCAAVILLGGALLTGAPNPIALVASVLSTAFAMGIQSESVQQLGMSGITGNVITSTLVNGIRRLVNYIRLAKSGDLTKVESPMLHFSCWLAYLVGAILGGISAQWAFWIPFALSALSVLAVVACIQSQTKAVDVGAFNIDQRRQ